MSVSIRNATQDDFQILLEWGHEFFQYGKFVEKGLRFDVGSFKRLVDYLISDGILLIAEDEVPIGSVGGIIYPFMFDQSNIIATEVWWWVDPSYRNSNVGMKLLREFETVAKLNGATSVMMVTIDTENEHALHKYYQKFGYKHLEHHYIKEL